MAEVTIFSFSDENKWLEKLDTYKTCIKYVQTYYRNTLEIVLLLKSNENCFTPKNHWKLFYYRNSMKIVLLLKYEWNVLEIVL